jgi:hypothetical protein
MRLAVVAAHVRLTPMPLSSRTLLLAGLWLLPATLHGQGRRSLSSGDPQSQLLGYYGAALFMTPAGTVPPGLAFGLELTLLPALSEAERRVGFGGTKLEKTNFCPVLPRPRLSIRDGFYYADIGFVPPLEVCGVRALLFAAAAGRQLQLNDDWTLDLRGSILTGQLEAAITCPAEAISEPDDLTCYGGRESHDYVRPLSAGLDAMLARRVGGGRAGLYVLLGVRHERNQFDVNYVRDTLPPVMDDHERLQSTLTRAHVAAGASLEVTPFASLGGEIFYAPGALLTLRTRVSLFRRPSR